MPATGLKMQSVRFDDSGNVNRKKSAQRILFIGDSFSFWLDVHMKALAASATPALLINTAGVTLPGATLKSLWLQGDALELLHSNPWDIIVLEEDLSYKESSKSEFRDYARAFTIEGRKRGAKIVLFMPWAYYQPARPLSTEEIARTYNDLGMSLGVTVSPVGLAWKQLLTAEPDTQLYYQDSIHQSILGEYLTLMTLYASIFKQSPEGLSYRYSDIPPDSAEFRLRQLKKEWKGLNNSEATLLQSIAWQTVQNPIKPKQ